MKDQKKNTPKKVRKASPQKVQFFVSKAPPPITARADSPSQASRQQITTKPSREVEMSADWWTAHHSAFAGSDDSLHMDEIIEELGGIEVRRYLRIDGGTDLSRAEFEERETKAGLALNPSPGVEPLDHWRNELKMDQQENNPDYRPGGLEIVTAKTVGIGEEAKKKHGAELVKWDKAWKEAEAVINKDASIDSRTVDLQQVFFNKTVELATKRGVSPELIRIMRNAKQMVTRQSCIIPKVAEAAAAFCSRLAVEARKLERHKTKRGKIPDEKIIDRDREMARLAFEDKPIEVIAIHLDDLEFFTPKTWKKPKYVPKGEKYTTGIRVLKLRQSFLQMVSRAKKKYPAPAPSCLA